MAGYSDQDIRQIVPGLANAACPLPDVVSAGQPAEEELDRLAAAGFRTVLDLRAPDEPRGYDEQRAAERAGMTYVNLPVTPHTLGDETYDRFRELMADPARRPIVVHCATANRVGALLLPYFVLDLGEAPEEALCRAVDAGLRSQEYVNRAFAYIERVRVTRGTGGER